MKITLLILIILLCYSGYSQEKKTRNKKDDIRVYICNSMNSKRYHYKKNCNALQKCNDTIVIISREKARKSHGRTVCGFETHLETSSLKN